MKRLQVRIDEEMGAALERQALMENTSKSALVRRYVREGLEGLPDLGDDPIWRMAGVDDYEPAPVDEVVYG
jgi:hypothetical protein